MPSAVIVRARLPAGLERLRQERVQDSADGVPAHLTLLYPFAEPADLTLDHRRALEAVARRHRPFEYQLRRQAAWPDTVYVAVTPTAPFMRLQRELQSAYPDFPIYGRDATFRFVPHVTIAEGPNLDDPALRLDRAWAALPRLARAKSLEVIATGRDGRWRLLWRIPLGADGRAATATVDRMRA